MERCQKAKVFKKSWQVAGSGHQSSADRTQNSETSRTGMQKLNELLQ